MATWRGVPVRLHWLTPVAVLGGGLALGEGPLPVGAWLGMVLVLLCHVGGHAAVGRAHGLVPTRYDVHALGGIAGLPAGLLGAPRLAWHFGGALGQAALLLFAWAAMALTPPTPGTGWADLSQALVFGNLAVLLLNLVPFPGMDGARGWPAMRARLIGAPILTQTPAGEPPKVMPADIVDAADTLMAEVRAEVRSRREETG